jgi:predicted protein tyrosine phosphatase
MNKPHILFVCSRNKWRSPTAAGIYANDDRIYVRSAGLSRKSPHQISDKDLTWADLVLVMEQSHKSQLLKTFGQSSNMPKVEVLHIPDEYKYMDEELIEMIRLEAECFIESM